MNVPHPKGQSRLAGKRIIVTGAASGIGREIASFVLAEGASIGLLDRDEAMLRETVQVLGGVSSRVVFSTGDVLDVAIPAREIDRLCNELGGLDGIVCAAGTTRKAPVVDYSLADWNEVIGINLTGTFLCAQAAARQMLKGGQGGSIVIISSGLAVSGQIGGVAYVASKAGIIGMTKTFALELGPQGIRCNNIAPGVVSTPLVERMISKASQDAWASRNPLGRIGRPDDISPAACFLLSDEAQWITGQTMHINGGNVLT